MTPLSIPSIAILPAIHNALPTASRQFVRPIPAKTKLLKSPRSIAADHDICFCHELIELQPSFGSLDVDISVPLADLAIGDEDQSFGLAFRRYTQNVGAHQRKHSRNRWPGDDFRKIKNFDAGQWTALRLHVWPSNWWKLIVDLIDLVQWILDVDLPVWRCRKLVDCEARRTRHSPSLVGFDLNRRAISRTNGSPEDIFATFNVALEIRSVLWQIKHIERRRAVEAAMKVVELPV